MPISQAEIGRRIGTSRHAVNRWLNACDLPEAVKLRRLSRLASSFGLDHLADLFSSEGKRTLPVPDAFALNCVIDDELGDLTEAVGHARPAFNTGNLHEAERRTKEAIAALYHMLAEIQARSTRSCRAMLRQAHRAETASFTIHDNYA